MKNLIILFIITLLFSCNDKNKILDSTNSNNISTNNILSTNPYDSVGVIHNDFIKYARASYDSCNSEHFTYVSEINGSYYIKRSWLDHFLILTKEYFVNRGYSNAEAQAIVQSTLDILNQASLFVAIQNVDYIKDIRYNIDEIVDAMLSLGYISQDEYNELEDIVNAISSMNYTHADTLISSIDLSEYDINDYPSIYKSLSVYKHSKILWDEIYACKHNAKSNNGKYEIQGFARDAFITLMDFIGGTKGRGGAAAFSMFAALIADIIEEENRCTCPVCQYYGIDN